MTFHVSELPADPSPRLEIPESTDPLDEVDFLEENGWFLTVS